MKRAWLWLRAAVLAIVVGNRFTLRGVAALVTVIAIHDHFGDSRHADHHCRRTATAAGVNQ